MKADELLAKIRHAAGRLNGSRLGMLKRIDEGELLAKLITDLDLHLANGGALPPPWKKRKTNGQRRSRSE